MAHMIKKRGMGVSKIQMGVTGISKKTSVSSNKKIKLNRKRIVLYDCDNAVMPNSVQCPKTL